MMSNTNNNSNYLTFEGLKKRIDELENFETSILPIGMTVAALSTIGASALAPIVATIGISGIATTVIAGLMAHFKGEKKEISKDLQISLKKGFITSIQYEQLNDGLQNVLVAR